MFIRLCYGHFGVHFVFLSENLKPQTSFYGMKWHIYVILIVLNEWIKIVCSYKPLSLSITANRPVRDIAARQQS